MNSQIIFAQKSCWVSIYLDISNFAAAAGHAFSVQRKLVFVDCKLLGLV